MSIMYKWLIMIIVLLALGLVLSIRKYKEVESEWKTAVSNMKNYDSMLGNEKSKSAALQLSVSQLETFQDSVLKELNATREKLKVKDKNLNAVQYVSSVFEKTDTIVLKDTIFRTPEFKMDTVLGDEWYAIDIAMQYPSKVSVSPSFKSEKHIVVYDKKETVNPPKKFFLARWFQKKHKVLKVDVVEKNPYVEDEFSQYVEIVK